MKIKTIAYCSLSPLNTYYFVSRFTLYMYQGHKLLTPMTTVIDIALLCNEEGASVRCESPEPGTISID